MAWFGHFQSRARKIRKKIILKKSSFSTMCLVARAMYDVSPITLKLCCVMHSKLRSVRSVRRRQAAQIVYETTTTKSIGRRCDEVPWHVFSKPLFQKHFRKF